MELNRNDWSALRNACEFPDGLPSGVNNKSAGKLVAMGLLRSVESKVDGRLRIDYRPTAAGRAEYDKRTASAGADVKDDGV